MQKSFQILDNDNPSIFSDASSFLFLIDSEEIPALYQKPALEEMKKKLDEFKPDFLLWEKEELFMAPRYMGFYISGFSIIKDHIEKKGPLVAAGEKVFQGFCENYGFHPQQCHQEEGPKGNFWMGKKAISESFVKESLAKLCQNLLQNFYWPKRMRWPQASQTWCRPIRHLVCLYGTEVLSWVWGGIETGRTIRGSRFSFPYYQDIAISCSDDYQDGIKGQNILMDPHQRKHLLKTSLENILRQNEASFYSHEKDVLLEENLALVEAPHVLVGAFHEKFLQLPSFIVAITLGSHQRCFCLCPLSVEGKENIQNQNFPYRWLAQLDQSHRGILDRFAVVADGIQSDAVRKGYERVVAARLEDALFFWHQDQKIQPDQGVEALKARQFFPSLGSLFHKTQRLSSLITFLFHQWILGQSGKDLAPEKISFHFSDTAEAISGTEMLKRLEQAAWLSRWDLSTAMVGEFPELQGLMSYAYGQHHHWELSLREALFGYRRFYEEEFHEAKWKDACGFETWYRALSQKHPQSPIENFTFHGASQGGWIAAMLAIADSLDTLVGFFALHREPSGSKDPLALRRSALNLVKSMFLEGMTFHLDAMMEASWRLYAQQGVKENREDPGYPWRSSLKNFLSERIAYIFQDTSFAKSIPLKQRLSELLQQGDGDIMNPDVWFVSKVWRALWTGCALKNDAHGADFFAHYRRLRGYFSLKNEDEQTSSSLDSFQTPQEACLENLMKKNPNFWNDLPIWNEALKDFFQNVHVQSEKGLTKRIQLLKDLESYFSNLAPFAQDLF